MFSAAVAELATTQAVVLPAGRTTVPPFALFAAVSAAWIATVSSVEPSHFAPYVELVTSIYGIGPEKADVAVNVCGAVQVHVWSVGQNVCVCAIPAPVQ